MLNPLPRSTSSDNWPSISITVIDWQSLALDLLRCFLIVPIDGRLLVRIVALYPVNSLVMVVVIFFLSLVGWLVGCWLARDWTLRFSWFNVFFLCRLALSQSRNLASVFPVIPSPPFPKVCWLSDSHPHSWIALRGRNSWLLSCLAFSLVCFVSFVLALRLATGHTLGADFESVNKILMFFAFFFLALIPQGIWLIESARNESARTAKTRHCTRDLTDSAFCGLFTPRH